VGPSSGLLPSPSDSDATETQSSAQVVHSDGTSLKRHENYYLEDGNIIFLVSFYTFPKLRQIITGILQVDGILFNVHRYFFLQSRSVCTKKIPALPTLGLCVNDWGLSDENPIRLLGVTDDEFTHFLSMFYNPYVSPLCLD
jgi:hypothetical protein